MERKRREESRGKEKDGGKRATPSKKAGGGRGWWRRMTPSEKAGWWRRMTPSEKAGDGRGWLHLRSPGAWVGRGDSHVKNVVMLVGKFIFNLNGEPSACCSGSFDPEKIHPVPRADHCFESFLRVQPQKIPLGAETVAFSQKHPCWDQNQGSTPISDYDFFT